MPNQQDTDGTELEIVTTPAESEVDTQTTAVKGAEGEQGELSLDEESSTQVAKPTPAEIKAQQQEEAWFNKVVEGTSEITDAPKWLQPRLQKRLDTIVKTPEIHEIAKQVAQDEINRQREEAEFKDLQASLPSMSKDQADAFKAKFKQLLPLGRVQALRETMERFGFDPESQEEKRISMARGRMSLPPSGQPRTKGKTDMMSIVKDQKKWKELVRTSGSGMLYDEPNQ